MPTKDNHDDWYEKNQTIIAYEQEKPRPAVIYNHLGEPFTKPRTPLGFDLRRKK